MKKYIAFMLALVICFTMFAGCSSKEETTTAASGSENTTSADNTENNTPNEIVTATNTTFATLDPALISTTAMGNVYANTGANIFKTTASGEYVYDLGEDYEVSDDGLVYTFKIKEGLEWSDGVACTSDDWVFGIKRAIGYGPMNAYSVRNLTTFIVGAAEAADAQLDVADMTDVGVEKVDDLTFKITLKSPCPFFYKFMASRITGPSRADFAVEHESAWSVNSTYPSMGPMILESISPEEEAVYVKNEKYWDAENVTLDKITFLVMPDQTAQLNAFKAGELDIATSVPTETAINSQYADNFYKSEKYTSSYFALINTGAKNTVPALKDVRVRKAMNLAIDKDVMLEVLGGGDFNIKLDGFIPYGFTGVKDDFRSEASYLTYNLEEAKQLMTEAGFSEANPLKFEFFYSNSQFNADVAQMLQQFWSQIYIDVELTSAEGGVYYDFVDNGEFTVCRYANNDSTDPLNFFKIFTSDAQIEGCQAIADPKYDELVAEAYTITDPVKYAEKLHEIEQYMVEEQAYVIPLLTQIPVVLVQDNIEGFWTGVSGTTMYTNCVKK